MPCTRVETRVALARDVGSYACRPRSVWLASYTTMQSACSTSKCNLTLLGGLRPLTIVQKLSDQTRCPCASVPADALIVDGGVGPVTKGAGFDAIELLNLKPRWRALSFEPLPSNCLSASKALWSALAIAMHGAI